MRAAWSIATVIMLAGCTAGGEAQPASAAGARGDCFNALNVRTFRPVGRDAVDVEVNRRRVYRLSLGAGCFDIDWAQSVALRSRGGSFICSPGEAELVVPSHMGPDRCLVTDIRRLTPAEISISRRGRR